LYALGLEAEAVVVVEQFMEPEQVVAEAFNQLNIYL
jgi:hypothetical protein